MIGIVISIHYAALAPFNLFTVRNLRATDDDDEKVSGIDGMALVKLEIFQ
jgi:hypothetical protein